MGTGGPFTNTVQYPDGRIEVIDVPKAFSVGDVVAVTHRKDGGVVVQRVSPIQYDPIDGKITIYLGAAYRDWETDRNSVV